MALLLLIWLIGSTALVAGSMRWWRAGPYRFPFALSGLVIVIAGSVFGFEFFRIDKGPIPITIDRVLLLLLVAIFAGFCLRRRESVRLLDATDFVIGGLLVLLAISVASTDWSYAENRPLSRLIFFYLMPICLYFVVKHAWIGKTELKLIAMGLVAFGMYLGVTAILESRGMYELVFPSYIRNPQIIEFLGRGRGPFMNPVSNGIFMTTGLAAAMLLWWQSGWRVKILTTIAAPAIAAGAAATLTRSVWLGMAVAIGMVIWLPASRRQRAAMAVAAVCGAGILWLALGTSVISFKRDTHVTVEQMSQSAQLRPIFAAVAWEMFKDRPVLGCGFGQYGRSRLAYIQQPGSRHELRRAADYLQHNVFLSFLTETGLAGCTILVLLFARMFQVSWLLWRDRLEPEWSRCFSLLLMATLTSYLINGMFHDVSIIPMANMLLFFLLGIVANLQASSAMGATMAKRPGPQNAADFDRRIRAA